MTFIYAVSTEVAGSIAIGVTSNPFTTIAQFNVGRIPDDAHHAKYALLWRVYSNTHGIEARILSEIRAEFASVRIHSEHDWYHTDANSVTAFIMRTYGEFAEFADHELSIIRAIDNPAIANAGFQLRGAADEFEGCCGAINRVYGIAFVCARAVPAVPAVPPTQAVAPTSHGGAPTM